MTGPNRSDPLDELRRANPVDVDHLPSASLARVHARVQEDLMTAADTAPRGQRLRLRRPLAGALVAAAAGTALAVALLASPASSPAVADPSQGAQVGACVETYSPTTLRNRTFAFDGTVVAVSGDEVTFRVNESFRGGDGTVTLAAAGMTGGAITPGAGPMLSVGERFLVAGDDRFAWSCGFTQPWDPAVAAEWADALGS